LVEKSNENISRNKNDNKFSILLSLFNYTFTELIFEDQTTKLQNSLSIENLGY